LEILSNLKIVNGAHTMAIPRSLLDLAYKHGKYVSTDKPIVQFVDARGFKSFCCEQCGEELQDPSEGCDFCGQNQPYTYEIERVITIITRHKVTADFEEEAIAIVKNGSYSKEDTIASTVEIKVMAV
jgi:hypothetical protein